MDRRKFLTGLGSIGATATAAWSTTEGPAAAARANGLAKSAGADNPVGRSAQPPGHARQSIAAFTFGMLQGSSALVAATTPNYVAATGRHQWKAWDASMAPQGNLFGRAFSVESRVSIQLGTLSAAHAAAPRAGLLQSLEIDAHFAVDDGNFAPFYAWSHRAGAPGRPQKTSAPMVFDALVPDRMALQVNYALDAGSLAPTVSTAGSLYIPVGAFDGPGPGLYVIAGPSHASGLPADLSAYAFSGNLQAPLMDSAGRMPDFDYLTLSIHAA